MTAVENRIPSYHWHPRYWLPEDPREEPSVFVAGVGPATVIIPESFYNDVFALGCTMFYFLKRQHPFLGPLENDNDPLQQILHNIRINNAAGLSSIFFPYII
jgi:serine/threonine protein kinase